jgi:hypothetical protein
VYTNDSKCDANSVAVSIVSYDKAAVP